MKRHSDNNSVSSNPSLVQKWKYKAQAAEEAKKQKKELSNAAKKVKERERRGRMADSIESLRLILPDCKDNKKANQSLVMELAVKYIQQLEQKIEEQEALIHELTGGAPLLKKMKISNDETTKMDLSQSDDKPHTSGDMSLSPSTPLSPDYTKSLPLRDWSAFTPTNDILSFLVETPNFESQVSFFVSPPNFC